MRKIRKSIRIKIPLIRIYLEELKAIEEVYKENFETYEIITEDFELDSLDELKNIGKEKLSILSFKSSNPYIHVEFTPYDARIYSSEDSISSTGIVEKIKNILDKRITPLRYLISNWWFVLLVILFWSFALILPAQDKVGEGIVIVSFIGITFFWRFWAFTRKHSLIFLTNRRSQRNFFSRNKDKILLTIFGAIVGGFITFLVLWVLGMVD